MKAIKRIFLTILILTIGGMIFRGWFYRHLITYKSIGLRTNYSATNKKLIEYIDTNTDKQKTLDVESIIKIGLSITSKRLNFTTGKNDTDPNRLITSKTAHCVGYASFFATTCNYLLKENNLSDYWIAKPQIGQLYFFGTNIHKYLKTPFLKDHDFVTIENKATGKIYAVDPTINDYLCIDFINYSQ
ncbi:hypothetical protein PG630_10530 [Riemerella anatipestifer]|nr:hypothetical protein [Riemerella anatipestifer]